MANLTVTRTYVETIQNRQQVRDGLDSLGFAATELSSIVIDGETLIGSIGHGSLLSQHTRNPTRD